MGHSWSDEELQEEQNPQVLMWTLLFLGQHLDLLGDHEGAIVHLDEAIAHTPTCLDIYRFKARVYKHAGDVQTACRLAGNAREMDLQDRFINTKHVKYLYRAGKWQEALDTAALFASSESDPMQYLSEMQIVWMLLEEADCHLRLGNLPMALKRYFEIQKNFQIYWKSQMDYHGYCLRKTTITAYLGLLRKVAGFHAREPYRRSSCGIIRAYLDIWKGAEISNDADVKGYVPEKDDDPDGMKLAKDADPLARAWEQVEDLRENSPEHLEVPFLAYDVAEAMGKPLLSSVRF